MKMWWKTGVLVSGDDHGAVDFGGECEKVDVFDREGSM